MSRSVALVASLLCASLPAVADDDPPPVDQEGSHDYAGLKRYPGSIIESEFSEKEFEEFTFPIGNNQTQKAEGRYYQAYYRFPNKVSCTQVLRNFENAFVAMGLKAARGKNDSWGEVEGSIYANADSFASGTGKTRSGGQLSVLQLCGDNGSFANGFLVVVESAKLEQKLEVTSDFMAEEIEKNGRIALYGINFATGEATITADSGKTLDEIGKLLKAKADWKLRIEGHTDNAGKDKANLELSKKRALAVKAYLTSKAGIDQARLATDGFGSKRPLGENKTGEGRAKNRRVELVKL